MSSADSEPSLHAFSEQDKLVVYKAMAERRDMRHFNGKPLADSILQNILSAAHLAPSVGLMQPWRFIRIRQTDLRQQMAKLVEQERLATAEAMQQRRDEFLKLKVEGILQCSELLVAALPDGRESHIFGRRTMPDMDLASLSCAIQNMWLAARVEGIGMGWVSIFDPEQLRDLLHMPSGSKPVAILCIGHVDAFYSQPMLIEENWAQAKPLDEMLYDNHWGQLPQP
ncbi:MAG: 5,6-dimethylbenzimidazole synthase [Pseudomonadales bacterium]|nr:5,6-dimethylbenzimidazole synthase [Pseudomonadales bacterium]